MTVRRRAGAGPERECPVAGSATGSVAGRRSPVGPAPVVPAPVVPAPAGPVPVGLATVAAPGESAAGGAAGWRRGGRPGKGR